MFLLNNDIIYHIDPVFTKQIRCVQRVRIRNYSGPYFPAFELNTERYEVSNTTIKKSAKGGARGDPIVTPPTSM